MARKVTSGRVDPDTAFSSGLLHDVGKMVIACFLSNESAQLKQARQADRESEDYLLEERVLGFNHAQVGAFLAEEWKLPRRLINSIRYHHQPDQGDDDTPLAQLIHLADHVAKRTFYDRYQDGHLIGSPNESVIGQLQMSDEDLEEFCGLLRDEYVKAETFMRMAGIAA
jgi:putative nucleotidyltransferase with HDIG domain